MFLEHSIVTPQLFTNGQGWKEPLEVAQSKPSAQTEPSQTGFSGPDGFLPILSLHGWRLHNQLGQPEAMSCHPHVMKCFLMFRGKILLSVCGHGFWSCHWALLKRTQLCLCPLSSYKHFHINC